MNRDFTVQKKAIFVWKKNFVQRCSPEKNIPAKAVSENENSCKLKIPPPPHYFSNGPSLRARDHARGRRGGFLSFLFRAPHALSRAKFSFPLPLLTSKVSKWNSHILFNALRFPLWPPLRGGRGRRYLYYPIIVYSVANYRPYLSHFWVNM